MENSLKLNWGVDINKNLPKNENDLHLWFFGTKIDPLS